MSALVFSPLKFGLLSYSFQFQFRFALICSHCHGHNGMARKEEFDFLSYKCWICGSFNPSRQQRIIHTKSEENLCSESRIKTNSEEEEKEPSKVSGILNLLWVFFVSVFLHLSFNLLYRFAHF